jgi:enoyl-[acyl-carrier protein] reductase/trans-2-enoyl-CoA reductase (NAD+)
MTTIQLETFPKLPFGGVSPKLMAQRLAAEGASVAASDLARARSAVRPVGASFPQGSAVLMLGGSGGILRALAIQLLFGERVPVYAMHYDSEKLQIGSHHARALEAAAHEAGLLCHFVNADATRADRIAPLVDRIRADGHRCVHLINGIAAGATKRFAEHGTAKVRDLDIAFDPLRQIADFSSWETIRRFGLVDVEIATEADIERTYKFMGRSTEPWVEALQQAGLLIPRESLVAFTDYDYEHDDPVYALGPLAKAKVLQRESMLRIREQTGVRTLRLCYPAMNTTALGAIPGGSLMFAGTAQILLEQGVYRNIPTLAAESVPIFDPAFPSDELRVDLDFQRVLPEFHRRKVTMHSGNLREHFHLVIGNEAL